jgi:hypothetical protein
VLLMTSKPDHMLHCPPPNPRSKKKKKQLHRARDYVATNGWLSKGCNRLTSGTARNPCFKKAQKRTLSVPSTLRMDGIGMRGKSRKNIRHQIMQRGCCCCCCVVLWFCYNEVPHSNKPGITQACYNELATTRARLRSRYKKKKKCYTTKSLQSATARREKSSLQRDPQGPSQPHVRPGTQSMSRLSNSKRHQPSSGQPKPPVAHKLS